MDLRLLNCIEMIRDNAGIAEDSMVKFLVKCYSDCPKNAMYMAEALRMVLAPTEDRLRELIGIVVNDEGYFKWGSLDEYNRQMAVSIDSNDFEILGQLYSMLLRNHVYFDYGYVARDVLLDVDFICRDRYPLTPNLFSEKMPATIGHTDGGWTFSQARSKSFPKDYCIGMAALKETHPTAIDLKREKHKVIYRKNYKGFVDLDPEDRGLINCVDSDVFSPSSLYIESKEGHPVADDDVGLIYVPFKQARKKVIDGPAFTDCTIDTCLPRSICEKYSLPVVEI